MKRCALLLVAASCTTTKVLIIPPDLSQLHEVDQLLVDRPAKVTLIGKKSIDATAISLDESNLQFRGGDNAVQRVPLAALEQIKYLAPENPRGRGFLDGAGLGLVSGIVVGVVVGLAAGGSGGCSGQGFCIGPVIDQGTITLISAGAFGVLGFLTGGIAGAIVGHREALEPGPRPILEPNYPKCTPSPETTARADICPSP